MTAVAEGILPWARRQRDEALDLVERIERGEMKAGFVRSEGAMTDGSLKTIVILRRIIVDLEELLAESDGATDPSGGPA
jgi:hypothetical protein